MAAGKGAKKPTKAVTGPKVGTTGAIGSRAEFQAQLARARGRRDAGIPVGGNNINVHANFSNKASVASRNKARAKADAQRRRTIQDRKTLDAFKALPPHAKAQGIASFRASNQKVSNPDQSGVSLPVGRKQKRDRIGRFA